MKSKLIVSVVSAVVVAGCVGVAGYASHQAQLAAEEGFANFVDKVEATFDNEIRITYGDVKTDLFGGNATVSDVVIRSPQGDPAFSMSSLVVTSEGHVEGSKLPTSAELAFQDFKVVHEAPLKGLKRRMNLDLENQLVHGTIGYQYNDAQDLMQPYLKVSMPGRNDVDISIDVSNVRGVWNVLEANYDKLDDRIVLDRDENHEFKRNIRNIRLNNADFEYTNQGEIEKAIERLAEKEGMSVEELVPHMSEVIDAQLGESGLAPELKKFLVNPGKISVSLSADQPVSMEDVRNSMRYLSRNHLKEALEGIDVSIKAN